MNLFFVNPRPTGNPHVRFFIPNKAGAEIPAMAMRSDGWSLLPLLRHAGPLSRLLSQGAEAATGPFEPYMSGGSGGSDLKDAPYGLGVSDPWLRGWLDALAFSLSGLPASRTPAAAMAAVLEQLHSEGPSLDYPKGGFGSIAEALAAAVGGSVRACAARGGGHIPLKQTGSFVRTRSRVKSIDIEGGVATGLTLSNGRRVRAREGVICNAPIWTLGALVSDSLVANPELEEFCTKKTSKAEMTDSFLHLHLGLDATGLKFDAHGETPDGLRAHYTVMRKGLTSADPCAELNMIAVSCPSVLDSSIAPPGKMVVHAYAAACEPYALWAAMKRGSPEYEVLKESRSQALWEAVERIIPDARSRAEVVLVGSPLTHELWNRRPRGTYGASVESLLPNGKVPCKRLFLAGDGIFPGIGVPAVALSGASAANALVNPLRHWLELDALDREAARSGL
mmetsp:Transcript_17445/g.44668  ORF Transcript_17445/g.44668 Transcript_17445/m.44668 type:complete len:451 (+) Transcript_17445:557-1909(+)